MMRLLALSYLAMVQGTCPVDDSLKRVILWTAPRSGSSVFAKAMMQRNDTTVFFERLYDAHYLGPERRSTNYGDTAQGVDPPTRTYKAVLEDLLGNPDDDKALFFAKEMAYYYVPPSAKTVEDLEWLDLMDCFQHTFLLRNPRHQVPSMVKVTLAEAEQHQEKEAIGRIGVAEGWVPAPAALDLDELGVRQLHILYEAVANRTGELPVAVAIEDVFKEPERVMAAYAEAIGMEFDPAVLTWEKGWRPEFRFWDNSTEWMRDVLASEGFQKQGSTERKGKSSAPTLCPSWYSGLKEAEVLHEQLHANRITV